MQELPAKQHQALRKNVVMSHSTPNIENKNTYLK